MRNWCDRHSGLIGGLCLFGYFAIATALVLGIFIVAPRLFAPQPAAAKPVKPTASTVSCTTEWSSDYEDRADICKVTLKDGRTVTCVNIAKGTSCDWAHATTKKDK